MRTTLLIDVEILKTCELALTSSVSRWIPAVSCHHTADVNDLRHAVTTRKGWVRGGTDVTLIIHSLLGWQTIRGGDQAPKPKDIPSQEEFDKVRSEVDGI